MDTDPERLKAELKKQLIYLSGTIDRSEWTQAISAAYLVAHTARQLELNELRAEQEARFQNAIV